MPVWTGVRYDNSSGLKISSLKNKNWSRWSYFRDPWLFRRWAVPLPVDYNQLLTDRGRKVSRSQNMPCSNCDIHEKCHWLKVIIILAAVFSGIWDCTNKQLKGANWPSSGVFLAPGLFNAKRGGLFQIHPLQEGATGVLRVAIPQLVLALPGRVTAGVPMCFCLRTHPTGFVQLGGF